MTTCGSGMGGTVFPALSAILIAIYSWRGALLTLGGIFSGLLLVSAVIVRKPPDMNPATGSAKASTSGLDEVWTLRKSARTPALRLLFMMFLLPSFSLFIVFTYVPAPSLARGISSIAAAEAIGLLGAVGILARIASFALVRRLGTVRSVVVATAGMTLSTLVPLASLNFFSLYLFVIFYGGSYGLWIALLPSATAEFFGRAHYGQIWGIVNAGGGIGGLVGPTMAGLFLDLGGYDLFLLLIAGGATAIATLLSLVLMRNPLASSKSK